MPLSLRRLLLSTITAVVLLETAPALAQEGGRYYPETGHTLEARFVAYFDSHGGLNIFGYPITEGFADSESGTFIQYTENARLEWDAANNQVELRPLGEIIGGWHLPTENPRAEGSGCRAFEESGHATCFAFLDFFEENGGRDLFGLPISDFIIQNDRIVQYFQYFRLDWYPDDPREDQVRVAALGREHFRSEGYDVELLRPTGRGEGGAYRVTELRPSASILHPTLPPDGEQQVYLVVRDQNQLPVEGATAFLVAYLPGQNRYFLMPPSDEAGVSRRSLPLEEAVPGKVILEIWVMRDGLEAVTRDSFSVR